MKNIILKLSLLICFLIIYQITNSQNFNVSLFNKFLKQAEVLLDKQPEHDSVKNCLIHDFKVEELAEFEYKLKDKNNYVIDAHLHIDNLSIVYVNFQIQKEDHSKLLKYLINTKGYEWIGSEHNCDYLNNKKYTIVLIPNLPDKITVQVGKFNE